MGYRTGKSCFVGKLIDYFSAFSADAGPLPAAEKYLAAAISGSTVISGAVNA